MEHDDRTRANNLARLRKSHPIQPLRNQLTIFNPGTSATPLLDLATTLATAIRQLLQFLADLPMPDDSRDQLAKLSAELALQLDFYRDHRSTLALESATRDIGKLLRPDDR